MVSKVKVRCSGSPCSCSRDHPTHSQPEGKEGKGGGVSSGLSSIVMNSLIVVIMKRREREREKEERGRNDRKNGRNEEMNRRKEG